MRKGLLPLAALLIWRAPAQSPPANSYVDPALCSPCHRTIASTFAKTGMSRAFYRATPQNMAEAMKSSKVFFHEASHTYFETSERGGKFYQRRWQIGFDGRDTNVEEKQ